MQNLNSKRTVVIAQRCQEFIYVRNESHKFITHESRSSEMTPQNIQITENTNRLDGLLNSLTRSG